MNCPVCKSEPMIVLELEGVEIDHCLECKGIWLDSGELELLLGENSKKNELLNSFKKAENTEEKKRKCPICLKKMEKVFVGDNKILLDRCYKGHGLWFDLGELEEIIKIGSFNGQIKVLSILKDMFGK